MQRYFTTSFWISFLTVLTLVLLTSCKNNSTGSKQESPELTITSDASFSIEENQTTVGTISATTKDDDTSFSITGGTDQGHFSIDESSGALTFAEAPDFENPADADTNNTYQLTIEVSGDEASASQKVSVSVTDVNEDGSLTITSPTSFEIQENATTVGTITANTTNENNLEFTLSGDTKGLLTFSIDASSGELIISPAPDFETPHDDNSDNTYELIVHVTDGVLSTTQPISILVTNVVEVPNIDRGTIGITNLQTYSLNSTNQEYVYRFDPVPAGTDLGNIRNFSLGTSLSADLATSATVTGGADGGLFSVNHINTAAIHLDGPTLDYNHSADGNAHEYRFTVTAENAAGTTPTHTIIIPVHPFAGGSGTASDPYQVETAEQLQIAGQFLDAHFVQTANIDASATAGWNGGKGFEPIGPFSGSYDGGGFAISGLTIDRPGTDRVGLFGTSGGTLTDVKIEGADITSDTFVGALVGQNFGTIESSSATGSISGTILVGGLVGESYGGTITSCYSKAAVNGSNRAVGGLLGGTDGGTTIIKTSYATGNVSGSDYDTGGLVGSTNGTIQDSYATGNVSGSSQVGGLVGSNSGSIKTSYATGNVSGSGYDIGGLVGMNISGSTTQSYWDTQSTGQSTSDSGTGLTTSQMQGMAAETNMAGFDFSSVWQTNAGEYPTL